MVLVAWQRLAAVLCCLAALPAAEYSTFIGDANAWHVSRLKADAAGSVYVAGSRTFNVGDALNPRPATEAIVAKLDPSGKTVLFANLGGKGSDEATDVAVDGSGNIYVAGQTTSPNFPLRNALYSTPDHSGLVGFITKLNPDASQILYSTYFPETIEAIAVDAAGNAYVTGMDGVRRIPVTPGLPAPVGTAFSDYGAFLTKISAAGDRILYSTVISGNLKACEGRGSSCHTYGPGTRGVAVAVDKAGNAYVAGTTDRLDLPATPGALVAHGIGAFVAKVNAAGTALSYLTYLGTGSYGPYGFPATTASALAVDAEGNAYVVGSTFDPHLPVTPGAFQATFHGGSEIAAGTQSPTDAFAVKLNPSGTAAVWASYLGGNGADASTAAAVDSTGNLWVAGTTLSDEFPNVHGWSAGGDFIVQFDASGTALPYSARYPNGTASQGLAIDSVGLLHLAAANGVVSAVAPAPRPAVRPWAIANAAYGQAGGQIAAGEAIAIYGPHIGASPAAQAANTSESLPTSLSGVQVLFNDVPVPILYASDGQINAVVPFAAWGQSRARIRVVNQGATGPEFNAAIMPATPQIFRGTGGAAAINEDGSMNSTANPAKPGSVVSIWATGVSFPNAPSSDGHIAAGAQDYYCSCFLYFGQNLPLNRLYAGAAPGMVSGVVQINFQVPKTVTAAMSVYLLSWDTTSAAVSVAVKP